MVRSMSQHQGSEAAVSELLRQMIRKEKDYSAGLLENNGHVQAMAMQLAYGNPLEGLLDPTKLQEYRDTVKRLALQNVQHERQVKAYVQGLRELEVQGRDGSIDYPKVLKDVMNQAHTEIQQNSVATEQESLYLKVCDALNEPKASSKTENEDDDEIMAEGGPRINLKCPITGTLMQDPYKNSVCGHVYEKDAILNHLRKDHRKRCPVAGCSTSMITQAMLRPDNITATQIRREKVRQQRARDLLRASQDTIDMDDDEDENK
mmetsp:Transcript_70909/g.205566  ORF Transcript_70909/g.205566 Transcript_70909/m.205566 type:complete len:262 (+) Transcript_70909:101-886(+)